MNVIKIYEEILDALNKHDDFLKSEYDLDIRYQLKQRIKAQKIALQFEIELEAKCFDSNDSYVRLNDHQLIALFGEKYRRTISWSDDGRQPEEEWLYVISFPTGAYIFGEAYPTKSFELFFNELKTYAPKYSDTVNHNLYFDEAKAKAAHENFSVIFKKYQLLAKQEIAETEIKKLQEKLDILKARKQ